MSKRIAVADLIHPAHGEEEEAHQHKRQKLDQFSQRNERATLLGLPLELREHVYRHVLNQLFERPLHPYDEIPQLLDFRNIFSLRCLNGQIRDEVTRVLHKEYLPNLTLYFNDAATLHSVQDLVLRQPHLQNMRFYLRSLGADSPMTEYEEECKREDTEQVWEHQEGFLLEWEYIPRYYTVPAGRSSNEPAIIGDITEHVCTTPHLPNGLACNKSYRQLTYPLRTKSLRLYAFSWKNGTFTYTPTRVDSLQTVLNSGFPISLWEDSPPIENESGCMVFEGKLGDLDMRWHDLREGQWTLAAYQGKLVDGEYLEHFEEYEEVDMLKVLLGVAGRSPEAGNAQDDESLDAESSEERRRQ